MKGVSLSAPESAVTVILGPNGAGKTTLLRSLAGIYRVDKGRVLAYGMDVASARRRGILILSPDEAGLYPRLTGWEHVRLVERIYGCSWDGLEEAVELLGLGRVMGERVSRYSRGMRRKLQLIMALASCARVLLLDEPLSGLDIVSLRGASRLLRIVAEREGRAVIVTTHELWLAERLADYIVVLESGRVAAEGPLERLLREAGASSLEEYLVRTVYGGGNGEA
ncbi:ABC transporter ATP-binding protein [Pyrolobus fumarii]|uniref:ABC transporter ATP-binding protein n=1 Tax=Pyrolobus fumarii TaxID=54252 RepID=UPI00068A0474|nr:ABC transporter ATP-binding protein [Pyrolobus fumarii]